jgi:hypothetical protein
VVRREETRRRKDAREEGREQERRRGGPVGRRGGGIELQRKHENRGGKLRKPPLRKPIRGAALAE